MQQSNAMLSQEESYAPTKWTEFLWWLATAEKELIKDCVIDRNRYAIIGTTVFCTWMFATIAWMYFFSLVVSNPLAFIALGIFMGFIILCIDRALIKGITSSNKRKIVPFLFRLVLAATIGTFMAQPALLYLFKKEIQQQVSLDNEFKKTEKLQKQTSLYAEQKQNWLQKKQQLQSELNTKYNEVAQARAAFIAETDGTGGSKKVGLEAIARTKKQAYELLLNNYSILEKQIQPKIMQTDSALTAIDQQIIQEQQAFNQLLNNGFLTQIEGLNNLLKTSTALQTRYWLLLILLLLIELMPVIAKSILPIGTYDKKVKSREEIEATILQANQQHEIDLKLHYNQLAFSADKELIETFFTETQKKRIDLVKTERDDWKNPNEKSFNSFWKNIKKNLLTKQEH